MHQLNTTLIPVIGLCLVTCKDHNERQGTKSKSQQQWRIPSETQNYKKALWNIMTQQCQFCTNIFLSRVIMFKTYNTFDLANKINLKKVCILSPWKSPFTILIYSQRHRSNFYEMFKTNYIKDNVFRIVPKTLFYKFTITLSFRSYWNWGNN